MLPSERANPASGTNQEQQYLELVLEVCHNSTNMPVNPSSYDHRGGGNYGVVLRCPSVVADDHLVYFDVNKERSTWVIRDFITGQRLDNKHSHFTVQEIERDATFDEFPIWCSAEQKQTEWRTYLTLRTTAVQQLRTPLDAPRTPNRASGNWQPL